MTDTPDAAATGRDFKPLTPHVEIRRVIMLVNLMSGGVGARAEEEARELLAAYDLQSSVVVLEPGRFDDQIAEALAEKPDLLVVLAGDGTARTVASRAGAQTPLIAPLPGGTMNMLPRALYGTTDWKAALTQALEQGEPRFVSGGEVVDARTEGEKEAFYCAAIFGSPALWAPAREAVRSGKLATAFNHARLALGRAFSRRIRFEFDDQARRKAEALVLISPMISRALDEPVGLEAAAMDPAHAADAFRLAAHALFDDWRHDPSVSTQPVRTVIVRAPRGARIPAVIDGEPTTLASGSQVRFLPRAFRALAPSPPSGPSAAADGV